MKIRLDSEHWLQSDAYCYWITKDMVSKNGKEYESRVSGYLENLDDIVKDIVQRKIRSSEATQINELRDDVKKTLTMLKGWAKGLE